MIAMAHGEKVFESESVTQTLTGKKLNVQIKFSIAKNFEDTWQKIFVSIVDITELKKALGILEQNEKRLQSLLDSLPMGIFLIEEDTGIISDVNAVAISMIGLPADDIVGKSCYEFICSDPKRVSPTLELAERKLP